MKKAEDSLIIGHDWNKVPITKNISARTKCFLHQSITSKLSHLSPKWLGGGKKACARLGRENEQEGTQIFFFFFPHPFIVYYTELIFALQKL